MINMQLSPLTAVSPIDGRYASKTEALRSIFSEYALIRFRVIIEIRWLQTLASLPSLKDLKPFSKNANSILEELIKNFSEQDALQIKQIEQKTNHDVKAVEYFLKEKFASHPELLASIEFIHFACTSEDINNLAYALMLKTARQDILEMYFAKIISQLRQMAHAYADLAMLARTHGQPATPTTLGKEIANVVSRLKRQQDQFTKIQILGKFNGAVGNFNAHFITYPEIDWETVAKNFVTELGLEWNSYTTQIEPHDWIAEYCDTLARFNNILIDLNSDLWSYVAIGYFKLKTRSQEVGSSTMPHKVNPIDFENSEGNLSLANALLHHFSNKLPNSRWQRDLRDSTLLRNLGVASAHTVIAYQALLTGLEKLAADPAIIEADLNQHWEILAEAMQTILRRHQAESPYEKLKELTRGQKVNHQLLQDFIATIEVRDEVKKQLFALTPQTYLGNAAEKARKI